MEKLRDLYENYQIFFSNTAAKKETFVNQIKIKIVGLKQNSEFSCSIDAEF